MDNKDTHPSDVVGYFLTSIYFMTNLRFQHVLYRNKPQSGYFFMNRIKIAMNP